MLRSCAWLTVTVLTALLIVGGVVGPTRGLNGVIAAVVAAGLCWFGSTAALLIAGFSRHSNHAVQRHLLGMFFRLGLPLVAGVVFQKVGGTLAEAGVFGMIVIFYLISLIAETILSLQLTNRRNKTTPAM
jgi:uncharacterized membrane protein HdeD (DUF308 family)